MPASWTDQIDFQHVHTVLHSLPGKGDRTAYIRQIAAMANKSTSTIYRELARRFGKSKTVAREATAVTTEDVRQILLVKETYRSLLLLGQNRELSTRDAREILIEQGYERARLLVDSTLNTAIRRSGYRLPKKRVRVEPGHACQQYQIDFSRSKHFQITKPTEDGDWLLRVSAKELHYKDPLDGARLRTWVAQIIDEYSRLRIIRYYAATGEDRYIGLAAMHFLFNRADDDHLMRHIPERLKSDQGAFLKSQEGRSACKALGIDIKLTRPGNKESQGKVERGFRTTWQTFEARLATALVMRYGPKATITLSRLCRLAHAYTIKEHGNPHPVFSHKKRGAMYQQSVLQHRPQEVDIDVRDLALRTWKRWADASGMIKLNGVPFEVPALAVCKWVRVYRTLAGDFAGTLIDGYHEKPFNIRPYRFADIDDFSTQPHRTFQQEMAHEAALKQKRLVANLKPATDLVRPTTPIIEARKADAEPPRISKAEAMAEVGRALRLQHCNPEDFAIGEYVYGGITRTELDAVLAAILQPSQRQAI